MTMMTMTKKVETMRRLWIIVLALVLAGCGAAPQAQGERTLTIFAAASLTEAFTEIGAQFEAQNPGVNVVFNFAGSNQLAQQIIQGAPADVFASANVQQMDLLITEGEVVSGTQQIFAYNHLVLIVPADNPANIAGLADLARPGIKLVLAAPEVPVGQYSRAMLERAAADPAYDAGFRDAVLANIVSEEENVKAVVSKVSLGEADAGIVYSSDAAGQARVQLRTLEVPTQLNVLASYPLAPLVNAPEHELALEFILYVHGPDGQAALRRHGLQVDIIQ